MQGIGLKTERGLWDRGVHSWDHVIDGTAAARGLRSRDLVKREIETSQERLEAGDACYFGERLQGNREWRFFPEFRDKTAYLDIETTGLPGSLNHITTIALYDGELIHYYVHGRNLQQFRDDIQKYKVLVTYNGKCFDIPTISDYFQLRLDAAQIDLRYVLRSLGYKGGLKGCEKSLGLSRDGLDGVDGYYAVLLWADFVENRNRKALETLLAYNILDAVNLETLMVLAYNLKVEETPFIETLRLAAPKIPVNPFEPDPRTIRKIADRINRFHHG